MTNTSHNPSLSPLSIDSFGDSRQGRCRDVNDDQYLIAQLNRSMLVDCSSRPELENSRKFGDGQGCLLVVADGVSGAGKAREASGRALETVVEHALNEIGWNPDLDLDAEVKLREQLRETVHDCDERVGELRPNTPESAEPATTLTMALARWPHVFIAHVGDSRAYLIRKDGDVEQLTTDHTLAEKLVQRGELARKDIPQSPLRRMLWNAVGAREDMVPELSSASLKPGDTLMLCTDGISRNVTKRTIRSIVQSAPSAEHAAQELLDLAGSVDDADNMTVAIAQFSDDIEKVAAVRPEPDAENDVMPAAYAASNQHPP